MHKDETEGTKDVVSFNEPLGSVPGLIELDDEALATVVGGSTCQDNSGSCPGLTGCTVNTGSCPILQKCTGNDVQEK